MKIEISSTYDESKRSIPAAIPCKISSAKV